MILSSHIEELPYRALWPVAYSAAARGEDVALLDAASSPSDPEARYAVLGVDPARVVAWPAGKPGALDAIRALTQARLEAPPELPFTGGWLGFIGYDIGRERLPIPSRCPIDPAMPVLVLSEHPSLLVEDRRDRRLFFAGAYGPREGPSALRGRREAAIARLRDARLPPPIQGPIAEEPKPDITPDEYRARVERVLAHIRAGDTYQVNLAQRFTTRLRAPVEEAHRRIRAESPASFGALIKHGDRAIASVSPELFLVREGRRVVTRPIKGTRPRGADAREDAALRAELEASDKERAELVMIVDLLRNDLGRLAEAGSVRVPEPRVIEALPTVFHAIATVTAELDDRVDAASLVAATMPGGSVTGAPKIRAMQIIEAIEDVRRGPYCGSAGWIGYGGDLRLNILIRTLVAVGDEASFHVGGGIVADSDPEAERLETLAKARAIVTALGRDTIRPGFTEET